MKKNNKGFTLVEIIIVILIIAIIGSLSFTAFSSLLKDSHESNCEESSEKLRKKINSTLALNPEQPVDELVKQAVVKYGGNYSKVEPQEEYHYTVTGICYDEGLYTVVITKEESTGVYKATITCSHHDS